ncbi:HD domain-containing protein [Natronorubrum sp. JWXQ-INN-674]|uniref:HD domain-containing protein n=1 Tax=Natronorubrum halalkaliphilum TaxID=2691917 RepID=A0A6B0VHW7_9EURY|nr:HD domain-containing protein [Natronorubrum halalkaliphilum]MXV60687.1 HD domain-containing protein [Natronorubrum halalkaliphilum]
MTEPLSSEEVCRRLPTVALIDDDRTRAFTINLSSKAPEYFWNVPASTSGYHHPACQNERGLWAHTLMLSTIIERLGPSYVEQGLLEAADIDLAHAAAILHDQRKMGDPSAPAAKSTSDHDVRMAAVVSESPLSDRIERAVASHNGPWYDGPNPDSQLDTLVHTADMIASTPSITPGVQGPIPEELDELPLREVDLR